MKHCGTKIINTERLLLRPFLYDDCNDMLKNWASNSTVQAAYGEPIYTSEEEVIELLEKWINQYNDLEFYRWAIIEKERNENIGQIAFCKVYSNCNTAEIEYCIGENFWGKGYAGEALSAIIEFTFSNTGFTKLEAFHRINNIKSGRVLQKSSMQITDTVQRFIVRNQLPEGEVCYAIIKN